MYEQYFLQSLENIKSEGRYRRFRSIKKQVNRFPWGIDENGREIMLWCSNDYMGMGVNQEVIDAAHRCLDQYGVGSGGTRNISGTTDVIMRLERELAQLHNKEQALIFTSGYVANQGTIAALADIVPDLIAFSDSKNHASIIAGIRNGRLPKHIFAHNNMQELESMLSKYPLSQPKIIFFESIYSMDGDQGNIRQICTLAQKYHAMTYIDEVHAVGMYGPHGSGLSMAMGCSDDINIIQGTLGKAFGAIGGYIAGQDNVIDTIRSMSRDFIFTTVIPPAIAAAALRAIQLLRTDDSLREKHHNAVSALKHRLHTCGINFLDHETHIIPVMIGNAQQATDLSCRLFDKHAIYIQNINYPTVPYGTERLRITATPHHDTTMINYMVEALKTEMRDLNISS